MIHQVLFTLTFYFSIAFVSCRSQICPLYQLFYEIDGKCHQVGAGAANPCSEDLKFYTVKKGKPGYGECTCLPFAGNSTRPLVQWKGNDKCYWIYDQGPCPDGQWLVFGREFTENESKNAICAIRSCPESNTSHLNFWFENKRKCYQTETTNEEFCGNDKQKIYFALDKPEPICMDKRPVILSLGGVKVSKRRRIRRGKKSKGCPTGFKELRNGDCRRVPKKNEDDDSSDDSDDYSDEHSKESYKGSLGYGPYKGALGFEPHQGALGYEPHEGALGFEPHKGALGYEPHEGALGFEPHEGSLGYGPYKG